MDGSKLGRDISDDEILAGLVARFGSNLAVGLIHSGNSEAKLAQISPRQRKELKAKIETIKGVPVDPGIPERPFQDDDEEDEK